MSDPIIKVKNISKTFYVPHEKVNSLRDDLFSIFKTKTYEKLETLKSVSFEVKKGEFLGIIGRNGSGKSTLLKILAGVYEPDSGEIEVNGSISPFLELGVGFNGELTARENIYLNGSLLGLSVKQIDEKFEKIMKFAELEKFVDAKVKNFSSGMYARLAFSVAIEAEADIYIMDEVLAVGDVNFQKKCFAVFENLKKIGRTIIFVSHDISKIKEYCDRAIYIKDSKIVAQGNPKDVSEKYIWDNSSEEERKKIVEEKAKLKKQNENKQSKLSPAVVESPVKAEIEDMVEIVNGSKVKVAKPETVELKKKEAEIVKVEFFDASGQKKNQFKHGDNFSIRVYFKINDKKIIPNLNFILALYNISGILIFASNSIIDKVDTKSIVKKGYYEMRFKNTPLKRNSYYIEAIIIDDTFRHIDFLAKSQEIFEIQAERNTRGVVELEYDWVT